MRNINLQIVYLLVTGRSYRQDLPDQIKIEDIAPFCEAGELCCIFEGIQLTATESSNAAIISFMMQQLQRRRQN